jgi:protein SCO1/2
MFSRISVAASLLWMLSIAWPAGVLADKSEANTSVILAGPGIRYEIPDVTLINAEGDSVSLRSELATDTPVFVNFIFTSCNSFCPLLTATLAKVQSALLKRGETFKIISISIDPEQDTPARLQAYAQRFHASLQWHFLTGDTASTLAVQRAFDAYRGSKMNHAALTLMRLGDGRWRRFEGLTNAETLIHEFPRSGGG